MQAFFLFFPSLGKSQVLHAGKAKLCFMYHSRKWSKPRDPHFLCKLQRHPSGASSSEDAARVSICHHWICRAPSIFGSVSTFMIVLSAGNARPVDKTAKEAFKQQNKGKWIRSVRLKCCRKISVWDPVRASIGRRDPAERRVSLVLRI